MPAAANAADDPLLPALREDLSVEPGGALWNGAPSWLIHDKLRNRFFRIGRSTFELLGEWRTIGAGEFARLAALRFSRAVTAEEVDDLSRFLFSNGLTDEPASGGYKALNDQVVAQKKGVFSTLIHNYLFFRIPLFRPQLMLDAVWPFVRPLFTKMAVILFTALAVISLYLVSRQWDAFTTTFLSFLSFEGAVLYAVSLVFLKILHEFGHAFMAKKYGIGVPIIGLAFLVMMPVLYTDTSGAAALQDRRKRLMIDFAGIFTELAVAAVATALWVFLPDGPARSIAFTTATLSWLISLAVNLNPFMRFDGYYILSDYLGVENLQERGFAMARWRMREFLFAPGEAAPEILEPPVRRFLVLHAFGTWIYRFFLFLGIAVLVYQLFFKIVGIVLFVVEIIWFIVLPVYRELKVWWLKRSEFSSSRNAWFTLTGFVLMLLILCVPWSSRVDIPALVKSSAEVQIFPPDSARLVDSSLVEGAPVKQGEILVEFISPSLNAELAISARRKALLELRLRRAAANLRELSLLPVLQQELKAEAERMRGLQQKISELVQRAPFDGVLVNVDPELHPGQWLDNTRRMAILKSNRDVRITGLVSAEGFNRLSSGATGYFIPDDASRAKLPVILRHLSAIAKTSLDDGANPGRAGSGDWRGRRRCKAARCLVWRGIGLSEPACRF